MGIDPLSDSVGPEFSCPGAIKSPTVDFVLLFEIRKAWTVVLNSDECSYRCWTVLLSNRVTVVLTLIFICLIRRSIGHTDHADFRVESPLARGSPDAATSTW
ncbi:hypothetical protein HZH66_003440 [Vespula vulgaris]|uniref:Uncharacterized protein n=1 Tax=Vespula vulgaris TaxID=7454 RepID=A0A834KGT7_VESVU|nr:hypothetical protein HZH66_003440 [Vespula vulgaris]